jgi:hypothetical protein
MASELPVRTAMAGEAGRSETISDVEAGAFTEYSLVSGRYPRILHYCNVCGYQTPHAVEYAAHSAGMMCLHCAEHRLRFELDRD